MLVDFSAEALGRHSALFAVGTTGPGLLVSPGALANTVAAGTNLRLPHLTPPAAFPCSWNPSAAGLDQVRSGRTQVRFSQKLVTVCTGAERPLELGLEGSR